MSYVLDSDDDEQTWYVKSDNGTVLTFPHVDGDLLARMLNDTFRDGARS